MTSYDIPKSGKVAFILVSQSGETKDLHRCIDIARENQVLTVGVVNVVDSLIAREVDCGVYCNSGIEVGVASTKSFTSQVVCLSLVAVWFSQIQNENPSGRKGVIQSLQNLSSDYVETLEMCNTQICSFVSSFAEYNHVFLLGKGCDAFVAHEAALKVKEITYTHAEGHSTGALKHGPFALLDENFLVILLKCGSSIECARKTDNCYQEIRTRGAPMLIICNNQHIEGQDERDEQRDEQHDEQRHIEHTVYVKYNAYFGGLLGLIPLQLLSYYTSVAKGINPDTPKNLAKVVSVE
jgi:glucosamine--fructose-6-phosphate aminotransferase (isomerizing)